MSDECCSTCGGSGYIDDCPVRHEYNTSITMHICDGGICPVCHGALAAFDALVARDADEEGTDGH